MKPTGGGWHRTRKTCVCARHLRALSVGREADVAQVQHRRAGLVAPALLLKSETELRERLLRCVNDAVADAGNRKNNKMITQPIQVGRVDSRNPAAQLVDWALP